MIFADEETAILQALLKSKDENTFTSEQLSSKAHWRWNKGQFIEAAVLFEAAYRRCIIETGHQLPNRSFDYRVRAGVTFNLAGEVERAWPILEEATKYDWNSAGNPEGSHFTEWAFVEMLSTFVNQNNPEHFCDLFWKAVTRCHELGYAFPSIYPKQELLLNYCDQLGLEKELIHVIERLKGRTLSGALRKRIASIESSRITGKQI